MGPESLESRPERTILVGLYQDSRARLEALELLEELKLLAQSAGAEVVEGFLQERARPDPAFLVGRGKLDEIRTAALALQVDTVIFDDELSPAQLRNLENEMEVKVLDRGELILDIFAQRARSREGKLQVELAQLEYLLPRLTGTGTSLSRLGGGIGTRGPGETRLEVDRRTIRGRISRIKEELEKLEQRRALHRRKRQGIPMPTVSLVGYTNAGKSTLFNRLTREETLVSSKLFATLDPLVRKLILPSGQEVLVSDTVGFIRKLPHTLVAAFHATLEETLEADLVLHVVDVSYPDYQALRQAVYDVLEEIGLYEVPLIEVYNKIDQVDSQAHPQTRYPSVLISAQTGEGLDDLRQAVEDTISRNYRKVSLMIPFDQGAIVNQLRERARVDSQEYAADGIHLKAFLPLSELRRYQQFVEGPAD